MQLTRICLNMIVKNESAIIERSLASVAPILSYYVIADTGSTDGTQEIIRAFMKRRGIPGEIVQTTFRDFASARNEALRAARASKAAFDYILMNDADMELVIEDPAAVKRLTRPAYTILQRNRLSYRNVRLVRRTLNARYVGVTHEYLEAGDDVGDLDGLLFEDRADGANRVEKLERDIRLLTEALKTEPNNARYRFYLGQSYKDSEKWANAIEQYRRRIELGGWPEEVWYSTCMIAYCYKRAGNIPEFVAQSLAAYQIRPSRAEPLHALSKHYRETEMYDASLLIAEAGAEIPFPAEDRLFIEHEVYISGFRSEIGIAGFYSSQPERRVRGRSACFSLGIDRDIESSARAVARRNAKYYAMSAGEMFGGFESRDTGLTPPADYRPSNPSVAVIAGHRRGIVRTVNYRYENGQFAFNDGGSVVRTRNFLVEFDSNYQIMSSREINDRSGVPTFETEIRGFEDCRLFEHRRELWFTATVRDRRRDLLNQIVIGRLDEEGDCVELHVQTSFEPFRTQKNWMPLVDGDDLNLIYLTDPTQILRVDPASMQATLLVEHEPRFALDHQRGGSQALRVRDGWLAIVHEQSAPRELSMAYLHRFILFGHDFRVRSVTDPFWFTGLGIEFCAGLARDEELGKLVVSFGVNDGAAKVGFLDEVAVLSELARAAGYSYQP